MTRAIVRSGRDTWVNVNRPSRNYAGGPYLRLDSGENEAFIYFKSPVPLGATVLSATLWIPGQIDDATGSVTLTAKRVADSWKARRTTWDNKPGVVGSAVTVTKVDPPQRTDWEFDVTQHVQTMANGSANYGWKITSDSTTQLRFRALNAKVNRPFLEVEWSDGPGEPSNLSPSHGVVSKQFPVLRADYTDVSGDSELASIRVQIDAASDGSAPDFDSGDVATDEPELDLADTAYAGLADGESTNWRLLFTDGDGLSSEWSDWAPLERDAKGALVINNPAPEPSNFVTEYTPPIMWTLTGETQTHYQVRVFRTDRPKTPIYDSGKIKSTDTSVTLPKKVLRRSTDEYRVQVRVWDSKDREATPGDATFTATDQVFTVEPTGANPPSTLTATQVTATPWVDLTWTAATAPDSWTIKRDGKAIETDIDPADVLVSTGTYTWRDWTAEPSTAHTYRVRAEVNGELSTGGPTADITLTGSSIFIADPDTEAYVLLVGNNPGRMAYAEDSAMFTPLGADKPVKITAGMRGMEGSLTGELMDWDEFVAADMEATLLDFKANPAAVYQLAVGDLSIPVILGNINIRPLPGNGVTKLVTFNFWQAGDLPFEPEL